MLFLKFLFLIFYNYRIIKILVNDNDNIKDKWSFYVKNVFKKYYSKFSKEVSESKGILSYFKFSLISFIEFCVDNPNDKKMINESFFNNINIEKL